MDLESFWSWGTLTTFAGATACTGLFTQMLKNIVGKLPTQWLSYIIAVQGKMGSARCTFG